MSKYCYISPETEDCKITNSVNCSIAGEAQRVKISNCSRVVSAAATNITAENCQDIFIQEGVEDVTLIDLSSRVITPSDNGTTIIGNRVEASGNFREQRVAKNSDFTSELEYSTYEIDTSATGVDIEVTLLEPDANHIGLKQTFTKVDSDMTVVNINGGGSPAATINGKTKFVLDSKREVVTLMWNGTEWKIFSDGISSYKIVNPVISDQTVANTTTETEIFTSTVLANEFHPGYVVRSRLNGYYSTANASDTFTIRYKIGGTTILSFTSDANNVTNTPFDLEFLTTIRSIGGSGTEISFGSITADNVDKDTTETSTSSIDTTIDLSFSITVQWDNADASNTITLTQGYLERKH